MKVYSQIPFAHPATDRLHFEASFTPYLDFLRSKMVETTDISAKFYKYIISKFERRPELIEPILDMEVIERNEEVIQLLRMSLLPLSADPDDHTMALAFLNPLRIFYYTMPFKRLMLDANIAFNTSEDESGDLKRLLELIFERCYGVISEFDQKIIKRIYNGQMHTPRYYNVVIDSRFVEVASIGDLPAFEDDWLNMLHAGQEEFSTLFAKFPLEKFQFRGFFIVHSEDVSKDVAIDSLKSAILNMHIGPLSDTLDQVEVSLGELLNDSRIKIGITPFFKVNGRVVYDRSFITKCVIVAPSIKNSAHTIGIDEIYQRFSSHPEPYIFSKVDSKLINSRPYLSGLSENGIKSFMVYPIRSHDGLLGVFEIGSPDEELITAKTVEQLQNAFPIITDLIYYMIKSFDEKMNELIKEKFTSLQESVEWKFNEVAWQYLVKDPNDSSEIGNIVFDDVHPLYGAIDIRNSSIERNIAMRKDYQCQLNTTKDLLEKVSGTVSFFLLEDMLYKCLQYLKITEEGLTPEAELRINDFIGRDVVAFLKHLSLHHPEYNQDVDNYNRNNNESSGRFNHYRRAYETTLKLINNKVVFYLEEEIKKLQKLYPFYFEKYRSDGVEYNIYMGGSIAQGRTLDQMYLKNIRIWQLASMANIARFVYKMAPEMPLELKTTQLILVHSNAIQISFRKDEHRFDVEGSYNIRYEIIKKRINKVRIKDTLERLTQPGHIAVVYTSLRDIDDYISHIRFLQEKGLLTDVLEMHELEELQGVSGLKAIRVAVNVD